MTSQNELFEKPRKRSHDVAYLIALLIVLAATFAFAMVFVNIALSGLPIP